MAIILGDKYERLANLVMNSKKANYESVEDTLMDIAGYAILGLILSKNEKVINK